MPRLLWRDGITNLKNLNATYKVGIMFTIVVVALQSEGHSYFENVLESTKSVNDMIECFQMILCYWMWLKKKKYWKRNNNIAPEEALLSIREMLRKIISLWPREVGQKWNLAKVHEQLHLIDEILHNGAPVGFNSGPTERNHIFL